MTDELAGLRYGHIEITTNFLNQHHNNLTCKFQTHAAAFKLFACRNLQFTYESFTLIPIQFYSQSIFLHGISTAEGEKNDPAKETGR